MESVGIATQSPAYLTGDGMQHLGQSTPSRKGSANQQSEEIIVWDDPPSSPFMTEVADSRIASATWKPSEVDAEIEAIFEEQEDQSPQRPEKHPAQSYTPFEMENEKENEKPVSPVQDHKVASDTPRKLSSGREDTQTPAGALRGRDAFAMPPPSTAKRARPGSPTKAPSTGTFNAAKAKPLPPSRGNSYETTRDTTGMFEDFSMARDETNIDDTCFSTFSAVPDMTLFSRLGEGNRQSPLKNQQQAGNHVEQNTPRTSRKRLSTSRSPSPTPRRQKSPVKDGNTTSLLIDFTQQIESFQQRPTPSRHGGLSPSRTEPNLLSYLNDQRSPVRGRMSAVTPAKQSNLLDLLDFELPPPPTPRSAPAFSAREVESLKSSYLSQISSIKARLSGREAEVDSLKKALEDAERRVGEAQENYRNEKVKREQADQEKADWEKRGLNVEAVLKSVKEEVLKSEEEKETLIQRAAESECRAEEADARNLDLQARLASMPTQTADGEMTSQGVNGEDIQRLVQAQLDQKIESVSRELHAVYKKKHETKVATLKKSYEARSEKKTAELQAKVEELTKLNEDLQLARESTFSGDLPVGQNGVPQEELTQARQAVDEYRAQTEQQNARSAGLEEEIRSVRSDHSRLLLELEQERMEKGDLVAAVDEMLMLQSTDAPASAIEDFRKSISRPSGLRAPGALAPESRIGRGGQPAMTRTGSGKSKMMSNIERMGGSRTME